MNYPKIENLKAIRKFITEQKGDPFLNLQRTFLFHLGQVRKSYKDELDKKDIEIANLKAQLKQPIQMMSNRVVNKADMQVLQTEVEEVPKNKFERSQVPVMYLIVRDSLNMSPGKIAAQVGHGVMQIMLVHNKYDLYIEGGPNAIGGFEEDCFKKALIFDEWLKSPTKVVLKADECQWSELKNNFNCSVVIDGGFTEIAPNSETVIAFWPILKHQAPDLIKSLPLL